MNLFQNIAMAATIGAIAVLVTTPFAAAEQDGRYWVPKATSPAPYRGPTTANPAQYYGPATNSPDPYSGLSNDQPLPIRGGDNGQPSSILTAENDESRQARAEDCDKVHHQTVGHPARAKAIPSGCDGRLSAPFQNAPFGSAGQHE